MLATILPLVTLTGCGGGGPEDGATVKNDQRPQEGIDQMKNFMNKQKDAPKK